MAVKVKIAGVTYAARFMISRRVICGAIFGGCSGDIGILRSYREGAKQAPQRYTGERHCLIMRDK